MKKRVDKKQDKEIAVLKKQVKALGKTVERKYIDKVYYQQSTGPLTTNDSAHLKPLATPVLSLTQP